MNLLYNVLIFTFTKEISQNLYVYINYFLKDVLKLFHYNAHFKATYDNFRMITCFIQSYALS